MTVEEKKVGSMPIYIGAHRTKVMLEVDERVLFFVALLFIFGVFAWPFFIVGLIVFFIGRHLTERFPHALDDVSSWCFWNYHTKGRAIPDDVFLESKPLRPLPFRR